MMDVVTYMVGMVITKINKCCKDKIENLTNDWLGDSYLVLKGKYMVPRYRMLIFIC